VGQRGGELLLEIVLDLRFFVVQDVGDVGDYEKLPRGLGQLERLDVNFENL